jgi:hypothetical protein
VIRLRAEWLGFDPQQGQRRDFFFIFATAFRSALRPSVSPIQWVRGGGLFPPGVKLPGREAGHSPPSSANVKNAWSCSSTPQRVHGVVLSYERDSFTFTLPLRRNRLMTRRSLDQIPKLPILSVICPVFLRFLKQIWWLVISRLWNDTLSRAYDTQRRMK